jgi:epoxyqueuosine reductase
MDDRVFQERFRGSPVLRARRRGLLCQAAYALGNRPDRSALSALVEGLRDMDPAVQEACAWALARYDCEEARAALAGN